MLGSRSPGTGRFWLSGELGSVHFSALLHLRRHPVLGGPFPLTVSRVMCRRFAAVGKRLVTPVRCGRDLPSPKTPVGRYRDYRASIARSFVRCPVVAAQSRRNQLGRLASLAAWRAICARMTAVAC